MLDIINNWFRVGIINMKFKEYLGIILAGVLTISMVGCSSSENEKVENGRWTPVVEETKEEAPVEVAKMDEVVLADDDVVKIIVTEKSNDEIFGPMYKFLIVNKSDKKLTVQSRDTSIDGVMAWS